MKRKEKLCRILYIDTVFWAYTHSLSFIHENVEKELNKIKKEAEKLSIEEIRNRIAEIKPTHLHWYSLFEYKLTIKKIVDVEKLIIDEEHNILDGISNCKNKKISYFLKNYRNNKETLQRLNFVLKNLDTLTKFLPIVVKKSNNFFEIKTGNHRAMAFIKKGYKKIKVLEII